MSPSTLNTANRSVRKILFALILTVVHATFVFAQTTAFTYQGRLTDGGTPADGPYDMQFKLTDPNGNQFGATATLNGVTITNGVFTVLLNFGNQFPGDDRRLEIGIKPAGSPDPFTILLPRQPITSAPYAIRAGNAAQLGGVAADQYVLTNDPRFGSGNTNFIQNSNALQAANFNINGSGSATKFSAATHYEIDGQTALRVIMHSTHVGRGAGSLDTLGQHNTYVGTLTGNKNTGFSNTFIGSNAGSVNTGNSNTMVGAFAGQLTTIGFGNSFFGDGTGGNNKAGSQNTFVGYTAGHWHESHRNSFFGFRAGTLTSGNENAMFGAEAGAKNDSGQNNAFFGYSSGSENTTASQNAFFGSHSGSKNSTGSNNSFFGYSSGAFNTASNNAFFGSHSGLQNSSGQNNSFFGTLAGSQNQTGSDNAYFGFVAGSASKGSNNAFFGSFSAEENTTGFANSFFGMSAGVNNKEGFSNSFFGRGAGDSNIGGSNNTIIGALADVGSASLSFATAIGAQATVTTSNTIVLGRSNGSDTVQVPGFLTVSTLGVVGLTSVCRNALNQLATCSSSLRYKTNIAPFTRGLALLNKLKPITFDWRADNSADLGFGAEDVAAVEPLLVIHNSKGEVEGVKYDRITAVLVNAVKEQQEQIKQQQQQIEALKRLVCAQRRSVGVCK